MLVGLIPGVGYYLSVVHMAILYSLYSFEYKWMYQGKAYAVNKGCAGLDIRSMAITNPLGRSPFNKLMNG